MNPYALVSLVAAIICIMVANFIYYHNPKNRFNQLIAVIGLLVGFMAFVEFAYRQAESIQTASFWISISSLFYLVPALLLNTGLIFNAKFKSLSNRMKYLIYFFTYLPAIIFIYLGTFTNLLLDLPVMEFYGWTYTLSSDPTFFGLMSFYTILWALLAAIMIFTYYSNSNDPIERRQAKYVFIGLYFPLLVSLIFDIILPIFWQRVPEMTMTSISLGLLFMAYGTWRYQFPLLSPTMAAEKIINTMYNLLIILDYKNNISVINPAAINLLGYDESDLYGQPFEFIIEKDELNLSLSNGKEVQTIELKLRTSNNQIVPCIMSFSSIKIREDLPPGILCIGNDLTEEIKMREALHESEELYRGLVKTNPDSVVKTDLEGNIVYLSKQTILMHEYDHKEELYGKSFLELFTPECRESASQNMKKTIEAGSTKNTEFVLLKKDGSTFIGELNSSLITNIEKTPTAIIFTCRDITHHKNNEEKIKASLNEKEIMLREIHHRVKNNLQVISSLLNLQSRYIDDPSTDNVFKESQNRVKSMAMIHEKLYQSPDLAYIDFGEYIKSLIESLFGSYLVSIDLIKAEVQIEDIYLNVNTAIPLGLIVNEIISNSIKHAFPDDMKGNIKIKMDHYKGGYLLEISDDGIGFPEDLDLENTSTLGMLLINSLKNQIDAELELIRKDGTIFKLFFKSD
jgi:PAS domain S-box-containing protein